MSDLEPHYTNMPQEDRPVIERNPLHVVLDNIRSAYKVGSMFRTSDAAAVEHLHLCGMTAHPPHTKLEKTALGAFEYVPWTYHERTTDCLKALGDAGIHRVGIEVTDGAQSLMEVDWQRPTAVVFGNEVTGINDRVLRRCDSVVQIPMLGYKNSMNVATAFGVVVFEILRSWNAFQDRARPGNVTDE
jgi:23S rRNA (guanosine2251-2'-O)-methyltransferase